MILTNAFFCSASDLGPQNNLHGIDPDHASQSGFVLAPQWEYNHNQTLLTLRLYYHGDTIDTSLPDPIISPFEMSVPAERPLPDEQPCYQSFRDIDNENLTVAATAIDQYAALLAAAAVATNPAHVPAIYPRPTMTAPAATAAIMSSVAIVPVSFTAAAASFPASTVAPSKSNSTSAQVAMYQLQTLLLQASEKANLLGHLQGVVPEAEPARRKRERFAGPAPNLGEGKEDDTADQGMQAADEPPTKRAAR